MLGELVGAAKERFAGARRWCIGLSVLAERMEEEVWEVPSGRGRAGFGLPAGGHSVLATTDLQTALLVQRSLR